MRRSTDRRYDEELGFGRAVSRILSAPCGGENHLSERPIPETCPLSRARSGQLLGFQFGLAPDGVFRAASLALRAVRFYRTFSPLPTACAVGGLIFCGTVRRKVFQLSACVYPSHTSLGYAASYPMEFGLSSPDLRPERFSALPKPWVTYANFAKSQGKPSLAGANLADPVVATRMVRLAEP